MPRTRSLAWSELKIGVLTVFALATATVLIFLLSGEGGFFWQRYSLKTVFPNIAGLKPGANTNRGLDAVQTPIIFLRTRPQGKGAGV